MYELASGEPLSLSTTIADNYIIGNGGLNSEICMDIGDVDGITIDIYQMLDSCNMPMKAEIGNTENCGIFYQRDRSLMLVGGNTQASLAFRSDCQTGTIGKIVIRYSGNYIMYVSFEEPKGIIIVIWVNIFKNSNNNRITTLTCGKV